MAVKEKTNTAKSGDAVKGATKSSSYYMDQMRKKLRSQGMVTRDVWIHPDNSALLREIEKRLRQPLIADAEILESLMSESQAWSVQTLFAAISQHPIAEAGAVTVNLIDGLSQSIQAVMHDFGDLPIFVAVSGEQILVECKLFDADMIEHTSKFNDLVLRSRSMFPLSAVAIESTSTGQDAYVMYGALSSSSKLESVVTEIITLAANTINAAEAFESCFKK
jgi:uncharacterized protein